MIRWDMPVTEFLKLFWKHKIKVVLLFLVFVFGPGMYDDWQKKRAEEKFEADRKSVDTNASVAGMMLMNAWTSCSQIGIINDMQGCANYQARLLQEQAAPILAKLAIEQRDSYYKNCQRFYSYEYCGELLKRSVALSKAQGNQIRE